MKFPRIKDVSEALKTVNKSLNASDGECDVRLQVYSSGSWALRVGDSSYDLDHRGFWGCGTLDGKRFNSRYMARELISQCREMFYSL